MRLCALVFAASLACACEGGARQEADSLARALDRFRRADNADKANAIHDLRATRCTADDVCRARKECLAYAEPTVRALVLKADVEKALASLERDAMAASSEEARSLPAKLDDAERLLKEGMDHLEPCDGEVQALRRKHRL